MSTPKTILVTGASGFIGSQVTTQLLEAGHRVKGSARGAKVELLRKVFGTNPNFEAVEIQDVATDDFTATLQGVDAIIHIASPLAGHQDAENCLKSAVEGTLNVLRQAVQAGIPKVVLTGTWASTMNPDWAATYAGVTYTEKDWGVTTRESLLTEEHNPFYTYGGAKIIAEQAAWTFAEEHPTLDLAVINPPFVYGPVVPGLGLDMMGTLGTNYLICQLILGEAGRPLPFQSPPLYCHIDDVARAHVRALDLPKLPAGSDVRDKRFLVAGPGALPWTDAVEIIAAERPQLKDRLPSLENAPALPGPISTIDTTRAAKVLGMTEYKDRKTTLLDTVDMLIAAEKSWP
ncbi:hypothetical protein C2E23DRAFT_904045 [Lenzites betulinus]|nr:hypothetical protein C2E23DRAFT_904045 [Lenzites betulinus]